MRSCLIVSLKTISGVLGEDRAYLQNTSQDSQEIKWHLGTCIPDDMMWSRRSWLEWKTRINTLSFITDRTCGTKIRTQHFVDLAQFPELQSLTWRGLSRFDDCESVGKYIRSNGRHTKSLALDLIDWDTAEDIWALGFRYSTTEHTITSPNFFACKLLGIRPGAKEEPLPFIEYLVLSAVSFEGYEMEMNENEQAAHFEIVELPVLPRPFECAR